MVRSSLTRVFRALENLNYASRARQEGVALNRGHSDRGSFRELRDPLHVPMYREDGLRVVNCLHIADRRFDETVERKKG